MIEIPQAVHTAALELQRQQADPLAAYIYDLPALDAHLQRLTDDLPPQVALFYAVKANPDPRILHRVASRVHGLEIASGGELQLIEPLRDSGPFIFGGPGKLDSEIVAALAAGVDALHVESAGELERVIAQAESAGLVAPVLLRINPRLPESMRTRLTMAGCATAFGIDEETLPGVIARARASRWVDLQGFHIHALSHQLDAERHLSLLDHLLRLCLDLAQAHGVELRTLNLGGGIGVNYTDPAQQYDWSRFAAGLHERVEQPALRDIRLRFEMGRYLTAFCGYYLMEVMDLKRNHGEQFAICRGGSHQFRLPPAQGHSHPFVCLPGQGRHPAGRTLHNVSLSVAGQLCTPKDILARQAEVERVAVGDLLLFPLAGAYAWNISHQNFLCHPAPLFHYLDEDLDMSLEESR
ncbi:type III PLP-dependent enzyme [Marinobacterium sp. D7]|uniref:type III PLP-dependent enzyme n=1 Tax=Marinobacterium ramblicola TaxID=2849041 RepID=UPI001C2D4C1F|nr:type III PLP-dependent enzyme [Marinobacterium ramblicola]MBV1786817.1 type III PLP-dependent enzyme [Marinobacterium ramblicola]